MFKHKYLINICISTIRFSLILRVNKWIYREYFVLVIKQDVFRRFYIYGFSQKIILQSVYFYFLNLIFYNKKFRLKDINMALFSIYFPQKTDTFFLPYEEHFILCWQKCYQPLCHKCFHVALVFTFVSAKILSQRCKRMNRQVTNSAGTTTTSSRFFAW